MHAVPPIPRPRPRSPRCPRPGARVRAASLALVASLGAALLTAPLRAQSRVPSDPAAALPDDVRQAIAAIPDEGTPTPARHFPVSNEYRHDLLYPHLRGLGGTLVGVGSDQNYTMAAAAGAELLLLVDYDPRQPLTHLMYRALVSASPTRQDLVARFAPERAEESARLIAEALAADPRRDAVVRYFRERRPWFARYLERTARRTHEGTPVAWVGDDAMYAHVRALHRAGRIVAFNGDVTADRTLRAIGDAARRIGTTVRVVYFSNAEQFFRYGPGFVANMKNLPTDERSVVVRTVHHRRLPNPGPADWHYVVHDFPDFLSRLDAGYVHSFQIVADIVTAGGGRDGLSRVTAATPRVAGRPRARAGARAARPGARGAAAAQERSR
jgi:hypothetical protein